MSMQAVTPEELDAWLQSTEVTEEEDPEPNFEPSPVEAPPTKQEQSPKKKKGSWRRRSSLDEDNISSRPCFGVDASALLAEVSQEATEGEDNYCSTQLYPYPKRSSQGSSTVVVSNQYSHSPDNRCDNDSFKKRRVSGPTNDSQDNSQFNRRFSSYSHGSIESQQSTPFFRLVTDDSFMLDREAQFSRHSSQYSVPFHRMDQEARFSRRSSQFTVSQTQKSQGVESFLRAMEVSQRSHKMLMNNHQISTSVEEMGRSEAMRESAESRSLLVRLSRRSVAKNMTSGMNGSNLTSGHTSSNHDRIAADLRRMEEMLRAEQEQLARIRSEFT